MPLGLFSRAFCKLFSIALLCIFLSVGVFSAEVRWDQETVKTVLKDEIESIKVIARDEVVVSSVVQHNNIKLAFEEILRRDRLWQKSGHLTELKESLKTSDIGQFVETFKNTKSYYTEVFIADDRGALVAAYPVTSDTGKETKKSGVLLWKTAGPAT